MSEHEGFHGTRAPHNFAAIVVCYHSAHLLAGVLSNLRSAIPYLDEVILVNNGQEDLSRFEDQTTHIANPGRNLGYGAAVNFGMQQTESPLLLILNPDVHILQWQLRLDSLLETRFLLTGVDVGNPYPKHFPGFCAEVLRYSIGFLWDPAVKAIDCMRARKQRYSPAFTREEWISGGLMLTTRETLKSLGGFDENFFLYYEEVDLCRRAAADDLPVLKTYLVRYRHDYGMSSHVQDDHRKYSEVVRSMWWYHSKHESPLKATVLVLVLSVIWIFLAHGFRLAGLIIGWVAATKASKRFCVLSDAGWALVRARPSPPRR